MGKKKEIREKSLALEWIKDIVIAVIIAAVIVQVVKPTIVKERSMEPNFYQNDYLFVYRLAYKGEHKIQRGDVIVFRSDLETDSGKKKLLIKRVIGVAGDKISIHNGEVYVNGEKDDQSYTMSGETVGDLDETVPDGSLFCMGDNRDVSIDSRSDQVGMVSSGRVFGKVVFRLYPFDRMGRITNPYK